MSDEPNVIRVWFGHEFARIPTPITVGAQCSHLSWYIYMENNGIPGLQRNDEFVDDTCHGLIIGDMFVW